jgi:hypothetical protein
MTEFQVILRTFQLAKCISTKVDCDPPSANRLTPFYEREFAPLGLEACPCRSVSSFTSYR